jgi:hypothetical protein
VTVSPVADENLFKFSCASVNRGLLNSCSLDFQFEDPPANLIALVLLDDFEFILLALDIVSVSFRSCCTISSKELFPYIAAGSFVLIGA